MDQVELAKAEYELPRLTRMWSHLERQAGGRTRGMGEKQIEVDKRLLRKRMAVLRQDLEEVGSPILLTQGQQCRTLCCADVDLRTAQQQETHASKHCLQVKQHRRQYRARRKVPVAALIGYTNVRHQDNAVHICCPLLLFAASFAK